MGKEITKSYSNGEISIIWKPSLCIHSTNCWKERNGLPEVFDPRVKPWIKPLGADTQRIIAQVNKCPSGALTYRHNETKGEQEVLSSETVVEAITGGPLLVYGNLLVKDQKGNEAKKSKVTAFCRCGNSANKPFCDGSHLKHNFEG